MWRLIEWFFAFTHICFEWKWASEVKCGQHKSKQIIFRVLPLHPVEFVNSSGIEGSFHGVPVFIKTIAYIINNIFKKLNFTNENLQHFEIKLRKESSSISKKIWSADISIM